MDEIEITETSPWYRQYWAPWGYNIHYHDVQYIHLADTVRHVTKHFHKGGAFKHYCFIPRNGRMLTTRNYDQIVAAVKADVVEHANKLRAFDYAI